MPPGSALKITQDPESCAGFNHPYFSSSGPTCPFWETPSCEIFSLHEIAVALQPNFKASSIKFSLFLSWSLLGRPRKRPDVQDFERQEESLTVLLQQNHLRVGPFHFKNAKPLPLSRATFALFFFFFGSCWVGNQISMAM